MAEELNKGLSYFSVYQAVPVDTANLTGLEASAWNDGGGWNDGCWQDGGSWENSSWSNSDGGRDD